LEHLARAGTGPRSRSARIAGKGECLTKAIRISDDAIWDFDTFFVCILNKNWGKNLESYRKFPKGIGKAICRPLFLYIQFTAFASIISKNEVKFSEFSRTQIVSDF